MYNTVIQFREKVQKASAVRTEDRGVEEMWYEMKEALRKTSEVLGRTKPGRKKQKESWWWNDGVREALKEKKLAFKKWKRINLDVDRKEYKVRKKEAKRAVKIVRIEWTQELYDQLGTKEGEQRIYRIVKARQREGGNGKH